MLQLFTISMTKFTVMISINLIKKTKPKNLKVLKVTDLVDRVISKRMVEDFSFMMIMMQKMRKVLHKNLTIFSLNLKSLLHEF